MKKHLVGKREGKTLIFIGILIVILMTVVVIGIVFIRNEESQKENFSDNTQSFLENDLEVITQSSIIVQETLQPISLTLLPYEQQYRASCEIASVKAILQAYGGSVTEAEILAEIGMDNSVRYFDEKVILHWGDPQKKYLGNPDAKNIYVDGYGVYNNPIYTYLSNHGFSKSISKIGWDRNELFSYVKLGYPAIFWTSSDYKTHEVIDMVAPDGTVNPFMEGEHALVLYDVDDDWIYVMDVGVGEYDKISYNQFDTGFANLGNMAIVVIEDK